MLNHYVIVQEVFFIELICSAFVGVVIGLFFISTNMPIYMALAGAGVAGHLGTS